MRARSLRGLSVLGAVVALTWPAAGVAATNGGPMLTRWGRALSPEAVWTEYPRPQLAREHWLNLNGHWDYVVTSEEDPPPSRFEGSLLVPFPLESHLSGVGRRLEEHERLWYRRRFTLPPDWRGQRIKLHFGAVDWATTVHLNGREIGEHRGGYDAFGFDLTEAIDWAGTNELLVVVTDPTEGDQPRGKQSRNPEGIFYLPSSGIWQTVWLEPVPESGVQALYLRPELSGLLRLRVMVPASERRTIVEAVAGFEGQEVGRVSGMPGVELTLPLRTVQPWSPDWPALYDLTVTVRENGEPVDTVSSYFGLREIRVGADEEGRERLLLNGRPLFQMGVLDQGFWPDGLYTPPSDEAMQFDLETVKRLGFNLVRKHVKVEPARWYYWTDKLGLLVWQDMPSGNNASPEGRRQFETELHRMMEQLANHPSVVMWVLFNEGWGQFDTERLARGMKAADPTRLVNNASGWTDAKVGDVIDLHSYPEPLGPATETSRATVLGEFGGLGLPVEHHKWSEQTWGYQGVVDGQALTRQYGSLLEKVWTLERSSGLAAAVYTQLTDVETECNGFLTYDREVLKVDAMRVHQANRNQLVPTAGLMPLPNAQVGVFGWQYTTDSPDAGWMDPGFDASSWKDGLGGFGTAQTPNAHVNTEWKTQDIWLRREFILPPVIPRRLRFTIHHDEDAEVYLNGVLAASLQGYTAGYKAVGISEEAQAALRPGRNLIAIHCHQTSGGQYIDAGLMAEGASR